MNVAVIGAGTMGHGIAQVAAAAGMDVVLHDTDGSRLEEALECVRANLDGGVAKGKVTVASREETLAHLGTEADLARAVAGAALVVEAVPEDLDLKHEVFQAVERHAVEGAVFATNTSSLPVEQIARVLRRPGRLVGMHFFNPVHLMPLLEIVRAEFTSEDAVETALRIGRLLGKQCIVVHDAPGFATSRLGVVLGMEAIRMVEQGVASPEDIDKAMTLGYRHPVGPLRLTDIVGLDVRLAIAAHLHRALESEAFRPPDLLRRMVREGKLGRKSGEGFYRWE